MDYVQTLKLSSYNNHVIWRNVKISLRQPQNLDLEQKNLKCNIFLYQKPLTTLLKSVVQ